MGDSHACSRPFSPSCMCLEEEEEENKRETVCPLTCFSPGRLRRERRVGWQKKKGETLLCLGWAGGGRGETSSLLPWQPPKICLLELKTPAAAAKSGEEEGGGQQQDAHTHLLSNFCALKLSATFDELSYLFLRIYFCIFCISLCPVLNIVHQFLLDIKLLVNFQ